MNAGDLSTGRSDFDVVIVGASVAGCAAAILYAEAGLSVALLERSPDPAAYKRLCTHYIQASATPVLDRLGLSEAIEAAGGVRNSIDVWTRHGWIRDPATSGEYGYNIRRSVLDPMMRARAAATPGVTLRLGHAVVGLIEQGRRVCGVRARSHDGEVSLSASLVVAADGRFSPTAALAGIEPRESENARFLYAALYRGLDAPVPGRSRMWMMEPDVAYTFPNDDGLTVVAVVPSRQRRPAFKADLEGAFHAMLGEVPDGPDLTGGERVGPLIGSVHLPNLARPPSARGIAFLGDAALAIDPLWGTGCGFALQSADWLVATTAADLREGHGADAGLKRYASLHRRRLGGHARFVRDYARGRTHYAVERLMLAAAARDPRLAEHLFRFAARTIGPTQFLGPRALARAAVVMLADAGAPLRRMFVRAPRAMPGTEAG